MILGDRVIAFKKLGKLFLDFNNNNLFIDATERAELNNTWFTKRSIEYAFSSLGEMLKSDYLKKWVQSYEFKNECKRIGVIVPSNIPLVGFYDFLCVVLSGNIFVGKLSSSNDVMLPFLSDILCKINPEFKSFIFFEKEMKNIDLLIATGNDNTADIFNSSYINYNKIIRRNRTSVAILDGLETNHEYKKLAYDIHMYFGLGCRNVSKLFIPRSFDIHNLKPLLNDFFESSSNINYTDNYNYQKSIFHINSTPFIDLEYLLFIESKEINSPVSVVKYEYYDHISSVKKILKTHKNQIQCVVSHVPNIEESIPFGESQTPTLYDFPDGVDVMKFIVSN